MMGSVVKTFPIIFTTALLSVACLTTTSAYSPPTLPFWTTTKGRPTGWTFRKRTTLLLQQHKDALPPPSFALQLALSERRLSTFKVISNLGYYGWKPKGPYKDLSLVTAVEIKESIDVEMKPLHIRSIAELNETLPLVLGYLRKQNVTNVYPHGQYHIASLHVACTYRGLRKEMVDFYFGGSTLTMLATRSIEKGAKYLAALVPGTQIIMVVKSKKYVQNYSEPAFQFERFVTGKTPRGPHDYNFVEHMQFIKIAESHRVLVSAKIDAMDKWGTPVEIKTDFHKPSQMRFLFQLISGGCLRLVYGLKDQRRKSFRGGNVSIWKVESMNLRDVSRRDLYKEGFRKVQKRIRGGLEMLKKAAEDQEMTHGEVFEIIVDGKQLELRRSSSESIRQLFPNDDVVAELLL